MSYDLIFWKGTPSGPPTELWQALARGEVPPKLVPLAIDDVAQACERAFARPLEREGDAVHGPGFTASLAAGGRYLHVTCGWPLLKSTEGQQVLATIRAAGCDVLGAHCFNPQTEGFRRAPAPVDDAASAVVRAVQLDDSPAAWLALADKLRTDDDPRARLIEASVEGRPEADALELSHSRGWSGLGGPLAEAYDATLARGFLSSLAMRIEAAQLAQWPRLVRRLLAHPDALFLRTIKITAVVDPSETTEAAIQEIAEAPHAAALRTVTINAFASDDYELLAVGDVGRLLARAPRLGTLAINARTMALAPTEHASLHDLTLRCPTLPLAGLVASRFPALVDLTLWFGTEAAPGQVDPTAFATLLAATAPALRFLRLARIANTADVVAAIVAAPGCERLERLELDGLDDGTARALLAWPGERPHLKLGRATCDVALARQLVERFGDRLDLQHPALEAERASRRAAVRAAPPRAAGPTGPAIGDHVSHAKFGGGVIVRREGPDKAAIKFDDGSERTLLLRFVTVG